MADKTGIFRTGYVLQDDFALPRLSKEMRRGVKVISHAHRFILFAVPKSGSQTLVKSLVQLHQRDETQYEVSHASAAELLGPQSPYRDYARFGFVRHPFTRAVSCYIAKVVYLSPAKQKMCEKAGMIPLPQTFGEYVDFVCSAKGLDEVANPHWGSQAGMLSDAEGRLFVDIIGRVENLIPDLTSILASLGVDFVPPPRRVNDRAAREPDPRAPLDNMAYWTPEIEARLKARYAQDYELFGYGSFGPGAA